jgi:hypothetical protein
LCSPATLDLAGGDPKQRLATTKRVTSQTLNVRLAGYRRFLW